MEQQRERNNFSDYFYKNVLLKEKGMDEYYRSIGLIIRYVINDQIARRINLICNDAIIAVSLDKYQYDIEANRWNRCDYGIPELFQIERIMQRYELVSDEEFEELQYKDPILPDWVSTDVADVISNVIGKGYEPVGGSGSDDVTEITPIENKQLENDETTTNETD